MKGINCGRFISVYCIPITGWGICIITRAKGCTAPFHWCIINLLTYNVRCKLQITSERKLIRMSDNVM